MCKLIGHIGDYLIFESEGGFTVRNKTAPTKHAHLKTFAMCKKLIELVDKKIVPDRKWFRMSAYRITTDRHYQDRLMNEKPPKQPYVNPQKGKADGRVWR